MKSNYRSPPSTPDSIFSDTHFKTSPLDEGGMLKSEYGGNSNNLNEMDYNEALNKADVFNMNSSPIKDSMNAPTYFDQSSPYRIEPKIDTVSNSTNDLYNADNKLHERIDKMFRPLEFQQRDQQKRPDSIQLHPTMRSDRHSKTNRYLIRQHDRNERREALKTNYRGSMGDFVLKQEDLDMKHHIEKEAGQNQINDVNRFLDNDMCDIQDDHNTTDRYLIMKKEQEQQLEDFLDAERFEMEELTRNLSPN